MASTIIIRSHDKIRYLDIGLLLNRSDDRPQELLPQHGIASDQRHQTHRILGRETRNEFLNVVRQNALFLPRHLLNDLSNIGDQYIFGITVFIVSTVF